jgi:ABC-2 type transport system ATP-binding protein
MKRMQIDQTDGIDRQEISPVNPIESAMFLSVKDITHYYDKRCALDQFSVSVPSGKVTALLGPNGAGKSTVFKLLAGLIKRQSGSYHLGRTPVTNEMSHLFQKIGFVFQEQTLDMGRTGLDNLKYSAGLHGLWGTAAHDAIKRVTALFNCDDMLKRPIRTMSGGERRRIEIARALIHRPNWLLLDEPSVGLDISSRRQLSDELHRLVHEQGLGILWCTHVTDELRPEDELVILNRGVICLTGQCGSAEALLKTYHEAVLHS